MTRQKPAPRLLLFTLLFLAAMCGRATAQNSGAMPSGLASGAPAGAYPLSDFESINFFSGHLNFRLPLVKMGGRGGARFSVPFVVEQTWVMESYFDPATQSNVYYESDNWRKGLDPGFSPGVVQGYTARFFAPDACPSVNGLLTHPQTLSYLTFTAADGTQYNLYSPQGRINHSPCEQGGVSRGKVFTSADGSAATFVADDSVIDYPYPNYPTEFAVSGYLLLRDGTRYRFASGQFREMRDRHGNTLTADYDFYGRVHMLTDSLGRVVTINYGVQEAAPYGENTQLVFSGFGGAQRVVRLSRTPLRDALRGGYAVQPHGADATPYDPPVTSSVWLPDGRRYRLFYNDMAELARVELPTGGAIEYDHAGGLQGGDPEGVFEGTYDGVGGNYVHIYRRLVERRLYPDGASGANWRARMTVSKPEGATAAQTTGHVEVNQYEKKPDGSVTLLACERHIFNGSARPSIEQSPFSDPPTGAEINGREARTEVYDTAGGVTGALLRKVETTWTPGGAQVEGAHVTETRTTLSDTNQVARQTFSYDRYGNQTDVYEYEYGSGASGPLVRHTHTDFLTTNVVGGVTYDYACDPSAACSPGNINPNPAAALPYLIHLRGLPLAQRVYGVNPSTGAEVIAARDETRYDEAAYAPLTYAVSVPGWSAPATPARGDVTSVRSFIDAAATVASDQTCPSGVCVETHARHDQLGNLRYEWDARGNKSEVLYGDSFCNGSACGAAGYTPNTFAFPTTVKTPKPDASGAYASATELTSSTVYDFYTGLVYSATDANGKTATLRYDDALDRLTAQIRPGASGGRTDIEYHDAAGDLYVRVLTDLDDSRRVETRQYYDGLGRGTRSFRWENQDASKPWLTADTQYDALGRAWRVSSQYRSAGPGSAVNPSGRWTQTTFDALGRATAVKSTTDTAATVTAYEGNRVLVTDPAGKKRISAVNALGRLVEVWEVTPADAATVAVTFQGVTYDAYRSTYSCDVLGNVRTVTQGAQTRTFVYDSLSRLTSATNPESGTTTYAYDNNGNLIEKIDPRGTVSTYGYDALNRNTTVVYTLGGPTAPTPNVKRYYDGATLGLGRLWKSESVQGALVAIDQYDEQGRVKQQTQKFWAAGAWGQGYVTRLDYNKAGGVVSETYPSNHAVYYNYDAAGRPGDNGSAKAFGGSLGDGVSRDYASQVRYHEMGGREQERFGTDTPVFNKALYNGRGQMAEIRVSTFPITDAAQGTNWNRGAIINHYSNSGWGATGGGPDNNGDLKKQDIYIPDNDQVSGYSMSTLFFNYDYLGRLQQAREAYGASNLWVQYFDYDRWGNRKINQSLTTGSAPKPQFELDPVRNDNRLYAPGDTGIADTNQRRMRYDAAGNLTREVCTDGVTLCSRSYDAENRMKQAQFVSGQLQTAAYAYDADGRRVKRNEGAGSEVWQVYGIDGELLAEYAQGASPASPWKEYGYRAGQLLVTAEAAPGSTAVGNTGFESPTVGAGNYLYNPSGGTWTFAGMTGVTADGSNFTGANPGAPEGAQVAFLQGGAGNYFSQSVANLQPGVSYTVSFKAAQRANCCGGAGQDVRVYLDTTLLGTFHPTGAAYETFTTTPFTTTAGAHTLKFEGTDPTGGYNSALIDDVRVAGGSGGGGVRWLVSDQLGTPRMVVDQTGSLSGVRRHDYLPFGEEITADVNWRSDARGYKGDAVRQKFTGYERDDETGLDFAGARYYSKSQGRFTSVDPFPASAQYTAPQSWNLYTYALNTPLTLVDPTGEKWAMRNNGDGTVTFQWYEGDSIPTGKGWEGKWTEYTSRWFFGTDEAIFLSPRSPDDVIRISQKVFDDAAVGGPGTYDKLRGANPAALTQEQKELVIAGFNYLRPGAGVGAVAGELAPLLIGGLAAELEHQAAKSLSDILQNATRIRPVRSPKVKQYDKPGGFNQANEDFDSLRPSNVKPLPKGGRSGELPDGTKVSVRPSSTSRQGGSGPPTLQANPPTGRPTKIRYK